MRIKRLKKVVAISMAATMLGSGSLVFDMPKAEALNWGGLINDVVKVVTKSNGSSGSSSSSSSNAGALQYMGYQKHAVKNMNDNEKLFMLAVKKGDVETAEAMLNAGCDINGVYNVGGKGCTPLFVAIDTKNRKMQQMLLENGADIKGYYRYDNVFCSYLSFAARERDLELMKYLHNWGAPINTSGSSYYDYSTFEGRAIVFLSMEVYYNTEHIFEYLLQEGIDPDSKDEHGDTSYIRAVRRGNAKIAKLMAAYGADLNARDKDGKTAEQVALERNNLDMYKTIQEINARGQQSSPYLAVKAKEQAEKKQQKAAQDEAKIKNDKIEVYKNFIHAYSEVLKEETEILRKYGDEYRATEGSKDKVISRFKTAMDKCKQKYQKKLDISKYPNIKLYGATNQQRFSDISKTAVESVEHNSMVFDPKSEEERQIYANKREEHSEKIQVLMSSIAKDLGIE